MLDVFFMPAEIGIVFYNDKNGSERMIKQDTVNIIDNLPNSVSRNDLMYHLYVRQKIEQGRQAAAEGKVFSGSEARQILREQ